MTIQELLTAAEQLSPSDQVELARQLMQTATQKLQVSPDKPPALTEPTKDPLIGIFDGSPDLSTNAKETLRKDVKVTSGFTWKES